jgi:hypothetical protein
MVSKSIDWDARHFPRYGFGFQILGASGQTHDVLLDARNKELVLLDTSEQISGADADKLRSTE